MSEPLPRAAATPTPVLPAKGQGDPHPRRVITVRDWWDVARAAPRVLYTAAVFRLLGLYRGARWVFRETGPASAALPSIDQPLWQRRAVAIRRVAGRLPDARCIVRASTLAAWMQAAGLPARVVAGVPADFTRDPSRVGHAWVECGPHQFDDPSTAPEGLLRVDTGSLFTEAAARTPRPHTPRA